MEFSMIMLLSSALNALSGQPSPATIAMQALTNQRPQLDNYARNITPVVMPDPQMPVYRKNVLWSPEEQQAVNNSMATQSSLIIAGGPIMIHIPPPDAE